MADEKIRIRMLETVTPSRFLLALVGGYLPGSILLKGAEYGATANTRGAIAGLCENGQILGVKPGEFQFLEVPDDVLKIWRDQGLVDEDGTTHQ